jgi:hypothetical protein
VEYKTGLKIPHPSKPHPVSSRNKAYNLSLTENTGFFMVISDNFTIFYKPGTFLTESEILIQMEKLSICPDQEREE